MALLGKIFGSEAKGQNDTQAIEVGVILGVAPTEKNPLGIMLKFNQVNLAGLVEKDQATGAIKPVVGRALLNIKWQDGVQPPALTNMTIKVTEGTRQGTNAQNGQPETYYDSDVYGWINLSQSQNNPGKPYLTMRVTKPLLNGMIGNVFPVENNNNQNAGVAQGQGMNQGMQQAAPQMGVPPQGVPQQAAPAPGMAPQYGQPAPHGAPGMVPPQGGMAPGMAAPQMGGAAPMGAPMGAPPGYAQ